MKIRFQADADLNQKNLAVAVAVEDLLLVWSATEAQEWINRISFLPL